MAYSKALMKKLQKGLIHIALLKASIAVKLYIYPKVIAHK